MHVCQSTTYLQHVVPQLHLLKWCFVTLGTLDQFLEISLLCPFCCNDQLIVEYEGIQVLDYIGMIEWLHQLHFLQALLSLLWVHHIENLNFDHPHITLIFFNATTLPSALTALYTLENLPSPIAFCTL
jgi:hypothetical protein